MTLNGVMAELPNSVAFGANCIKVVEDTPILSETEIWPKTSSF